MDIPGIAPIYLPTTPAKLQPSDVDAHSFEATLGQAIEQLSDLQSEADASATALATGQDVDLAEVMLNMERATLGFELAIQVRNRVVEVYQDIVRMQI